MNAAITLVVVVLWLHSHLSFFHHLMLLLDIYYKGKNLFD